MRESIINQQGKQICRLESNTLELSNTKTEEYNNLVEKNKFLMLQLKEWISINEQLNNEQNNLKQSLEQRNKELESLQHRNQQFEQTEAEQVKRMKELGDELATRKQEYKLSLQCNKNLQHDLNVNSQMLEKRRILIKRA